MERFNSELEIFSPSSFQSSIVKSFQREYNPISPIQQDSTIDFFIPGSDLIYLDLSKSYLYIIAKITTAANANPGNGAEVGPINLTLHSLFGKLDVELGGNLISDSNGLYSMRAYLETLLNSDGDTENRLHSELWHPDTAGQFEDFQIGQNAPNRGLNKRAAYFSRGAEVEMMGRLHADIFNQPLALLSNLNLKIKLYPNPSNFVLVTPAPGNNAAQEEYKIKIIEARMLIQSIQVSPALGHAHNQMLQRTNARYPILRGTVKLLTIPEHQSGTMQDNIYLGQIPSKIIVAMVSQTDLTAGYQNNPFRLGHNNLTYMAMHVNGEMFPSRPFQPDFQHGRYLRDYESLFEGTGKSQSLISRAAYPQGYTLWIFNLTPAFDTPSKPGSVRLEVKFAQPLAQTINIILYAEFKSVIEIDKYRNVTVSNE